MPGANGEGFIDFLCEVAQDLLDSDDDTDLPEAIREVARHPLFQDAARTINRRLAKFCLNGGPYKTIKRAIERWKEKAATKVSKLVDAPKELSAVPPPGPWDSVKASSPVLPPGLQNIHQGVGHQNFCWSGGRQFIAENQHFGKDGTRQFRLCHDHTFDSV